MISPVLSPYSAPDHSVERDTYTYAKRFSASTLIGRRVKEESSRIEGTFGMYGRRLYFELLFALFFVIIMTMQLLSRQT